MHLTKLASIQLIVWKMLELQHQDPASVFKKVQLNPELMYQPGARYSLHKIDALWQEMENRIEDPCFGLAAGTCWHPSHFGIMGYAMLVSTSLRITLERLIRFHRVISDVNFGKLYEDEPGEALIFTLCNVDGNPYSHAREDAALAWLMSILRINFQSEFTAFAVNFTHHAPECIGKYYEFFKSPVNFNSPVSSLVLPLNIVELASFNDQLMTKYLTSRDDDDLLIRVKKCIVEHLPSGNATVDNIASDLFYSSRKFQRLLQQEGTSFLALLNDTRMQLAKEYVHKKNADMTEIAFLLGFSELSAFSRSFKRWTGKSPSQYRKVV